jgi:immune inhibitor A
MKRRTFALLAVVALLVGTVAAVGPVAPEGKSVQSLAMFQAAKFDAHYRVPNEAAVERLLQEQGVLLEGASPDEVRTVVGSFMEEFVERNPTTPNPGRLRQLLAGERSRSPKRVVSPIKSLAVPVEFPNTDTFEHCGETVTTVGPLHNEIPAPGPRDNNTIWYPDATPELYEELFFGVGPDAGVIVDHPSLGPVDLRGNTMANYYLEQSEWTFMPAGMVYPSWLQAAHSEGWYGADACPPGTSHNIRAHDLVKEVVDLVIADDPDFPWQDFDGDGDGIVDNFTVIHAGLGQEYGGGAQGDFSIWSHASLIDWPSGKLACTAGSTGCPDRDIYVREYSMDPENIDIGVIAEEFGHAAFGLPDIYTTDYQLSVANWAIMEAGAWNGPLGGMQPAPFPLWFRYVVGWADLAELDYTEADKFKVGQLSQRPPGTWEGLKINLPDQEITVPNPLGTGNAWWSDVGDLMQNTLTYEFDLTGTTEPIFSFASYWSIEVDYDYGYFEVSEDDGATWTILDDMDTFFTDDDPNGANEGWGLTGEDTGTLRFDLSAYAGETVLVRLRYSTDLAVQWGGWWGDDFSLDDRATNLFSDDVEGGAGGWVADGWRIIPVTEIYPRYYLVEWRNLSGFDEGLQYPYQTVYSDDDEWEVDRSPYSVPGMLLWYRDTAYGFDYVLSDSWYDPPSMGPKHALIVVDSHPFPYGWDEHFYSTGAPVRLSGRVQAADATFTQQDTMPFTIRLGYDPATGEYVETPLETKDFGPRPAVSQFHDSVGYYPGFYYPGSGLYIYWWDIDASAVTPAQDDYGYLVTDLDNIPLWGTSGNPGDYGVQFGLHLAVVDQARDGSWGMIWMWNSPTVLELEKEVSKAEVKAGQELKYTLTIRNTTPVEQWFALDDPIPEHTTFSKGKYYDAGSDSIHWEGTIAPYGTLVTHFWVSVDSEAEAGTIITNEAYLTDGALGDSATVTSEVK